MNLAKKNIFYVVALLVCLTFITDAFFVFSKDSSQKGKIYPQSESIFSDPTPRIDDEAASITREVGDMSSMGEQSLRTLPPEAWIFILLGFIVLLVFNLAYEFESATELRWSWELVYFLMTLFVWFVFDQSRENLWFPLYTIKLGLIIYLAYLYFYNEKKTEAQLDSEF